MYFPSITSSSLPTLPAPKGEEGEITKLKANAKPVMSDNYHGDVYQSDPERQCRFGQLSTQLLLSLLICKGHWTSYT